MTILYEEKLYEQSPLGYCLREFVFVLALILFK